MPLEADDQIRVDQALQEVGADQSGTRLVVLNASLTQKLGFWTVIGTVVNRSIGSGIFVTPAILLKATGSPGASLLLWALGSVLSLCALLVWLEFGLSTPKFELQNRNADGTQAEGESLQSVPKSGGEKNYLEYVYGSHRFTKLRTTCMYGVIYITLGNLSGNCIAFGLYVLEAAGLTEHHDSLARGLAVVCMTAACVLHSVSRQGGIYVIIIMAIFKVCILLAIIGIGFAAIGGHTFGNGPVHGQIITDSVTQSGPGTLGVHGSFAFAKTDFASYTNSILFVVYTFSGSEQPFYVLSEVIRPKKIFAKATISAVCFIILLFMLVHIAFLGVVSYDPSLTAQCLSIKDSLDVLSRDVTSRIYDNPEILEKDCKLDMATVFFGAIFGRHIAPRVMAGIIAFSIFGNVVVMTFTASRVKQEIAKEGILPMSLFFSRSVTTPWALFRQRVWPDPNYEPEQSPTPALLLHWIFSMILIGATSGKSPIVAYQILVSLYSWTIVLLIGLFTGAGLLYARYYLEDGKWVQHSGFKPVGGPTAAVLYTSLCAFLLAASFVPPKKGSPFLTEVKWYIIPTVGLAMLLMGYVYYCGVRYFVPRFFKRGKMLVADREAVIVFENGEYSQYLEIVDTSWESRGDSDSLESSSYEMDRQTVTMAK